MPAFRPHTTETVDETWDAGEQEKNVLTGEPRSYYAKIYAWYDPDLDEGNKGTYKFIHHEVSDSGEPEEAVIRACTTGIGVLNGGMGGTTIPAADRQGVYDHLAKHLRDADREPPELKGSADSTGFEIEPIGVVNHFEIIRQAQAEPWAIMPTALQALLTKGGLLRADADRIIEVEALSK